MDLYPLNLVLAVAVALGLIFLGFLPAPVLAQRVLLGGKVVAAGLIWIFIESDFSAGYHPRSRRHRPRLSRVMVAVAPGKGTERQDGTFMLASGLRHQHRRRPYLDHGAACLSFPADYRGRTGCFLLASIYLGGAVIGLAYVCFMLTKNLSTDAGVTRDRVRRYVGLLGFLVIARGLVLLVSCGIRKPVPRLQLLPEDPLHGGHSMAFPPRTFAWRYFLPSLSLVILPVFTLVAMRATRARASPDPGAAGPYRHWHGGAFSPEVPPRPNAFWRFRSPPQGLRRTGRNGDQKKTTRGACAPPGRPLFLFFSSNN